MQTKEITFYHLRELVDLCNLYVRLLDGKKNALSVRIEKISPSLKKGLLEYNSKVEDIRTDHCSVDADGNMLIKEGQKGEDRFSFKPKELKAMRVKIKAIDNEKTDIEINITGNVPKDISYLMAKYSRGILIPEEYVFQEPEFEEEKEPETSEAK